MEDSMAIWIKEIIMETKMEIKMLAQEMELEMAMAIL